MSKEKLRGKIYLGGTIHIEGPVILKRLAEQGKITLEEDGKHIEFYLHVKNGGDKDALIEVTPWIDLTEADVEISTDAKDDDPIDGIFTLIFKGPDGRNFDLQMSINQARVISRLVSDYVQAHDLQNDMKKSYSVRALVVEG